MAVVLVLCILLSCNRELNADMIAASISKATKAHVGWLIFRLVSILVFFFQAEDGIRDIGVTGVQTCALPIYSRHLIIPDVAMDGQKRLKNAKVLCVGAGGLGSPTLMYLAAAGVGTLGVVDFDVVDESNLQRQVIHGQSDVGRSKAESAKASVQEINPLIDVVLHQ